MKIATNLNRMLLALAACVLWAGSLQAQTGMFTVTPSTPTEFRAGVGATATNTFNVTNTSGYPLTINVSTTGDGSFSINGLPSYALLANATQPIIVAFSPTVTGETDGSLVISGGGQTTSVDLIGKTQGNLRMVFPDSVNFNSARLGGKQCRTITLFNPSANTVTVSNISVTGSGTQFALDNSTSTSTDVRGNADTTITVCFTPSDVNPATGTVNFNFSIKGDTVIGGSGSISLRGQALTDTLLNGRLNVPREVRFEDVLVGQQTCEDFTITNDANSTIMITGATVTGVNGSDFRTSFVIPHVLETRGASTVTVCYTPSQAVQDAVAQLNLTYRGLLDSTIRGTVTTILRGSSELLDTTVNQATRCLHANHRLGVVGPVVVGGTASGSTTIYNTSGQNLTLTGANFTGTDAGSFTLSNSFPTTIQAGGSQTINYNFVAGDTSTANFKGMYSANLNFTLDTTGNGCESFSVFINGVAVPGANLGNSNDTLDLSGIVHQVIGINTNGNTTGTRTVTFTNTTGAPMTITCATLQDNTNFNIAGTTPMLPVTLQPGDDLNLTVNFTPTANGFFRSEIAFCAEGSVTPPVFEIQGIRQAAARVAMDASASVNISVTPNPSQDFVNVNVSGARKATIGIFTVLGQKLANFEGSTAKWDAHVNGAEAAAGTYIVRVNGVTNEGLDFTTSRRVVIER
jgi:hypothetical protein